MGLEPIQQVAILVGASALALFMAMRFRQRAPASGAAPALTIVLREAGLGVLTGAFVALAALAAASAMPLDDPAQPAGAAESIDPAALACVLITLLLLCGERGRWTGHRLATLLAALVPWALVPEWGGTGAARLPVAQLGLASAALYRVLLSGAMFELIATKARTAAIEATGDGVIVVDREGRLLEANARGLQAYRSLTGSGAGQPAADGDEPHRLPERIRALLGQPKASHFCLRNGTEGVFEIWLCAADPLDRLRSSRSLVVRDISDRRREERHLQRLAHYDSLTGLPNRRLFVENLEAALRKAQTRRDEVALFYIDLDRFKEINDTLGHGAGDEMLRVVAERFRDHMATHYRAGLDGGRAATVARLGGDEFAVILPAVTGPRVIEQLAEELLDRLSEPMPIAEREITASGSIGIAVHPADGHEVETLVKHADSALYAAKRLGRRRFERYQPAFSREADRTRLIEQELRRAIERGELELHYQPKVDVETQTVHGFEALLRWKSDELGPVSPSEFIPVAEERGLIASIGAWCVEQACEQLRAWRDDGYDLVPIAVNVSSAQFIGSNLQHIVREALEASDVDPVLLELELTERLLLEDDEQTSRCLSDLKQMGVRIALDDFGTGYSALTYLSRFPLDVVKMDRDLLRDIETSESAAGIAAAVISMSHSLGLEVVAEGVDAEGQLTMLREMRCNLIQGFLYAPALRASDVARFLGRGGAPRPTVEPKSAPPLAPSSVESREREVEPEAWQETADPLDVFEPAEVVPTPRALILTRSGDDSLEPVATRLTRLGVEVSTLLTDSGPDAPSAVPDTAHQLVVTAPHGDLAAAGEILDELSSRDAHPAPSLLVVGDEPGAEQRARIREAGVRWVLWAPFDDADLGFLVDAAMHLGQGHDPGRTRARVPMDSMAWIRSGPRREVGVLSSLSRDGAFIEMSEPFEPGASIRIEFELEGGHVSTFATVLDHRANGQLVRNPGMGVSFYGLDPASRFAIREYVEANAAKYVP